LLCKPTIGTIRLEMRLVLVVQWIEHGRPKAGVGGSIPSEDANEVNSKFEYRNSKQILNSKS
jgi:hypothetical protein